MRVRSAKEVAYDVMNFEDNPPSGVDGRRIARDAGTRMGAYKTASA
jgi:hypothetical protein